MTVGLHGWTIMVHSNSIHSIQVIWGTLLVFLVGLVDLFSFDVMLNELMLLQVG